ncbi:peptidoglycan DD-metalloendopeptidase family protein [Aliifodinibius salicampi]|uniref:Peptidoglycan DD-metalloendopeptidase family protein n=1 Tax=Fodinibius salicampi TaxID=1920655 RepID=A0ABT3PV17_9BACT|nr:peptidoglycan DD-metalloendopeptidase family protein [Fodinibius salicampi]MCW9711661.1 peptidoglycan DD-metalloendopeptidase family protein [Fodinibius salicampi]
MIRAFSLGLLMITILCSCSKEPKKASPVEASSVIQPEDTVKALELEVDEFGLPIASVEIEEHTIERNESLYVIFDKLDFDPQEIYSISEKAKKIIDFKKIRPGQRYRTYFKEDSTEALSHLVWQPNSMEYVVFDWKQDSLNIYKAARPLYTKTEVTSGVINNSLYQTISHAGGSQLLAHKLSQVFAWQIDFFSIRKGDSFKTLYEKKYVDDEFYGTGDVLAAQIEHRGELFRAYYFSEDGVEGYYTEEGESVQKALLKAPFEYDHRISSPFSKNRMHPTLNRRRPHNGVDYAAPRGTPVLSTGDGTVTRAGYYGASGNMIRVKHNKTFETSYLHLNGFASGVHAGARVEQGQVIGYVGTTGRSTGPHLHYEVKRNSRAINPLTMDLPSSESIPDSLMDDFKVVRNAFDRQLNQVQQDTAETDRPVITLNDTFISNDAFDVGRTR